MFFEFHNSSTVDAIHIIIVDSEAEKSSLVTHYSSEELTQKITGLITFLATHVSKCP